MIFVGCVITQLSHPVMRHMSHATFICVIINTVVGRMLSTTKEMFIIHFIYQLDRLSISKSFLR